MKKNILVVDDSALMRRVICDIINSDDTFQAVDTCRDGAEAYERLKETRYDGVILDVNMPKMDGLALLEKLRDEGIKATVIMVSTLTTKDADVTIRSIELGAVDFVTKPTNIIEAKGEDFKKRVLAILTAVLKTERFKMDKQSTPGTLPERGRAAAKAAPRKAPTQGARPGKKIVALACSTGGPKALQSVIPLLPKDLGAPMVLVQHMPAGFTKSMADRLDEVSKIHVKEAEEGDVLKNGTVYIAPGGRHMEVAKGADGLHRIKLNDMPAIGGLRPCANIMFDSLRETGYDLVVCVVLTGMGADGTNGILSLAKCKPVYVIAQDAETSIVYGMPKAIAETGLVDEVVPLADVAESIKKNVEVK